MDALTEALNAVRIRSTVHCPTEASGEWGVSAAGNEGAKFCIVLKGVCWLQVEGAEQQPVRMREGDFAMVSRCLAHTIRTTPTSPVITLEAFLDRYPKSGDGMIRCGMEGSEEGEKTLIIGGCYFFDDFPTNPMLGALPPVMHISDKRGREFGMDITVRSVLNESLNGRAGADIVLTRLSEVLFIQALRAHFTQLPETEASWFRAATDPQIGNALSAVHREPAHPWQVEELADRAAMSRSAFAARFKKLVGEPPLQHVTRWRIHKAARLLSDTDCTVSEIAALTGYQSEAAFSKVFKQWTGQSPSVFRRAR